MGGVEGGVAMAVLVGLEEGVVMAVLVGLEGGRVALVMAVLEGAALERETWLVKVVETCAWVMVEAAVALVGVVTVWVVAVTVIQYHTLRPKSVV